MTVFSKFRMAAPVDGDATMTDTLDACRRFRENRVARMADTDLLEFRKTN